MIISRRRFTETAAVTLFTALTSRKGRAFQSRRRSIAVHPAVEIGTINPNLHGQFAEHLGSCIYGGLWVGRNSNIPNINGYRKQAIEYLKALEIPVLRWPGGCFADDYHWRDGIGPKRPKRVNIHWGNAIEDNSFGTHEFIGLCRLIGAEPFFTGNVGSGSPQEMRDWVEYCNLPSGSTLAEERAANGSPEPFRVRYWAVGNENWGCGGRFTGDRYAEVFRQFSVFLRRFGDTTPYLIACGPSGNNLDWTRRFLSVHSSGTFGYDMHYYSNGRSPALKFTPETMREQFATFPKLEEAIIQQRGLLDTYDPQKRIGLLVAEWGVWDRIDPADVKRYGALWQQSTMRSAIAAALGLNVFHRQADKLIMANIAQTVNVLQSVLITEGDRCVRTTSYYAFQMLKPHRGKTSLRVTAEDAPDLSVSASRQGKELVITWVNQKHDEAMSLECALPGATAARGTAEILHHPDMNACNTFDQPDVVVPKPHAVEVTGSGVRVELPPLSIVTASIQLA